MARFDPFVNTFTSGELSPRLVGRDDLDQYRRGARRLRNVLVVPQGGATRRPGTWFVSEVADSAHRTRLIPFRYSSEIAYVVELGDHIARFYVNGGLLLDAGSPVTITTPWSSNEIWRLQYAQEADVLYIVHPDHPPYKLSRLTPVSFSLAPVVFSKGRAPMGPFNTNPDIYISGNAAGTTYARRLTFAAAHGLTTADIGRPMLVYRYRKSATVKYRAAVFEIKQIVSTTVIEADVLWEYEAGDAANISTEDSYTWALGLFSATEGCNCVAFHEGRLVYAGFKRKPDYVALSVSDDFDNFENENIDPELDESFNDDKAIYRRTVSRDVNEIVWLVSTGQALFIGTTGAEFVLRGTADGILTPSGAVMKQATSRGSVHHAAVAVEGGVVMIQRGGKVARRLAYDFESDQFTAPDISILCDHLFAEGVEEVLFQQWPYSTLWFRRSDGLLVGLTFDREQAVIAGHLHQIGGAWAGHLPAQVESITTIPGAEEDELWMVVKRTVNGVTKRFVEVLSSRYEPAWKPDAARSELVSDLDYAVFLDSALSIDQYVKVVAVSNVSPALVQTATPHGFTVGTRVRFRGFGGYTGRADSRTPWGMAELDNRTYRVSSVPTSVSFTIEEVDSGAPVNTTDYSVFADPNGTARVYREVNVLAGLDHLEGERVAVWADGSYLGLFTVSGGSIELGDYGSLFTVGYNYLSVIETMPLTGGNPRGSDRGRGQFISRVHLLLRSSAGGRVGRGPTPRRFEPLVYRLGGDPLDQPPPPYTGAMQVSLPSSWEQEPTVLIEIDEPQPFTLLGLAVQTQAATDA